MVSRHNDWINRDIADYVAAHSTPPPDDALVELRAETEPLGELAVMQVGSDQGSLLTALTRLAAASSAVEVGTFTGYSSICIARGLRPGGKLLCCDVSERYTAIARRAWERAGVADRIELRIAPALETLRALPTEATIDVAFVDADKTNYVNYFEELLARLRPGGLILADNTLWSGRVADPPAADDADNLVAIRRFNDHVAADDRVASYILPVADGLTLIVKL
jgi:caffeoyl-CoA O-methyltransferase